ncbi:MAG: TIGR03790 family protein, partial [Bacteroidales bacterium]|nr:TIGR03790 family protein [Bacteroidales bacterium]
MKNTLLLLIFILSTSVFAQTVPAFHKVAPEKLLIIYNENDIDNNNNGVADSKELALYYQEKRNVPDSNLLALNISVSNYYYYNNQWTDFWDEMVIPIRNKLLALGDTSIYYFLLCDRIPYKLVLPIATNTGRSLDNALSSLYSLGTSTIPSFPTYYSINPFYESSPTNFADKGSFNHTYSFYGTHMYLVSRLIGTDVRMNKNLIDMALYGDKYIYFDPDPEYYNGMAYADHRFGVYNDSTLQAGYHYAPSTYGDFDKDAAYIKFYYEEANFPYKQEANETEIGQPTAMFTDGSPADSGVQAILYGGWYNYNTYHDAWEWLPGSYACDLNSNSGASIRSGSGKFLSGSFANGLTCGTGCISEPYLDGHSQPDIFMH